MISFACVLAVAASRPSPAWDHIHHPTPISLLAGHRKLWNVWIHAEATGDYFWALSPIFFSKGRSRFWLMSRLSWTGWLANKTPWFQLTTYHRRQRTKREGNKNSCIVHCVNTLEKKNTKNMYVWTEKKNWPNSQMLISVSAHRHTQWFHQNEFQMHILVSWWDGKSEMTEMKVFMRW